MAAFAAGLVGVAYVPALRAEFQFDDSLHIVENPGIKDLGRSLHSAWSVDALTARPLAAVTFAIDYHLGGLNVARFHVTSLVWHLATSVLIFLLARVVLARSGLARPGVALLSAALFALHPLQTEAVTYVVQRAEVLAAFFSVATVLLLLHAERLFPRWPGLALLTGALLSFALGLASKQTAVVAPVLYVVVSTWFPERPRRAVVRALLAAPLLALASWYAVEQLSAVRGHGDVGFDVPALDPLRYAQTEGRVLLTYLRLLLWPTGQNVDWEYHLSEGWGDPATLIGLAGLVVLVVAAAVALLIARRSQGETGWALRAVSLGIVWFLVVLAPTSSVVPIVDILVEHRLYLASWGVELAVVSVTAHLAATIGAAWAGSKWAKAGSLAAPLAVVIALVGATRARNEIWASRVSLWADAAEKSPGKARPSANLGVALALRRNQAQAIGPFRRALALLPRGGVEWLTVSRNLAYSLSDLGRHSEAVAVVRDALREAPWSAQLHETLAIDLLGSGDAVGAEEAAREAIARDPASGSAHDVLGEALLRRGDVRAALAEFTQAVALDPDAPGPAANLARAQEQLGMRDDACASWARVLKTDRIPPRLAEARARRLALACPGR